MKKLLLSMACLAAISPVFAETVKFDFTAPDKLNPAVTLPEAGESTDVVGTTFKSGAIEISFDNGTNENNLPLIWNSNGKYTLRFYKGESVIIKSTGADITGIVISCNSSGQATVTAQPQTLSIAGTTLSWIGTSKEVTFSQIETGKTVQVKTIEVTYGEAAQDPNANIVLDETFNSSLGDFTAENGELPEGITYVWSADTRNHCAKASAYVSGTNYAVESMLVSPVIDLTGRTASELTFQSALNFAKEGTPVSVWVREAGATAWAETLENVNFGTGSSWDFVDNTMSLTKYDGKKIQLGFKYTSTSTAAATWEIKNLTVKGTAAGVNDIVVDENAPVEYYNLQGVLMQGDLTPGLYIRRQGANTTKVVVR